MDSSPRPRPWQVSGSRTSLVRVHVRHTVLLWGPTELVWGLAPGSADGEGASPDCWQLCPSSLLLTGSRSDMHLPLQTGVRGSRECGVPPPEAAPGHVARPPWACLQCKQPGLPQREQFWQRHGGGRATAHQGLIEGFVLPSPFFPGPLTGGPPSPLSLSEHPQPCAPAASSLWKEHLGWWPFSALWA